MNLRRRKPTTFSTCSEALENREMLAGVTPNVIIVSSAAAHPPSDQFVTFEQALETARQTPGPDEIRFSDGTSKGGTNFWDDQPDTIFLQNTLRIVSDVSIVGPGTGMLILDGGGQHSIFEIDQGVVTISGLTIQNGSTTQRGAGAWAHDGIVTFQDVTFRNNTANGVGGGLGVDSAVVNVFNSTFTENTSSEQGSAIFNIDGWVNIHDTLITGNYAGEEAAVYNHSGKISITDTTLFNNVSQGDGGAVHNRSGSVEVRRTTIFNNQSIGGNGGGINGNSNTKLNDSVIVGNADSRGRNITGSGQFSGSNNLLQDAGVRWSPKSNNQLSVQPTDLFEGSRLVEYEAHHPVVPWKFNSSFAPAGDWFIPSVQQAVGTAMTDAASLVENMVRTIGAAPVEANALRATIIDTTSRDLSPILNLDLSSKKTATRYVTVLQGHTSTGEREFTITYDHAFRVSAKDELSGGITGTLIEFTDSQMKDTATVHARLEATVEIDRNGVPRTKYQPSTELTIGKRTLSGRFTGSSLDQKAAVNGSIKATFNGESVSLIEETIDPDIADFAITSDGNYLSGSYAIQSNVFKGLRGTNKFVGTISDGNLVITQSKLTGNPTDAAMLLNASRDFLPQMLGFDDLNAGRVLSEFGGLTSWIASGIDRLDGAEAGIQKLLGELRSISSIVPKVSPSFELIKTGLEKIPGISVTMQPGAVEGWVKGNRIDFLSFGHSTTLAESSVEIPFLDIKVGIPNLIGFEATGKLVAQARLTFDIKAGIDTTGAYISDGTGFLAKFYGGVAVYGSGNLLGIVRATGSGSIGLSAELFFGVKSDLPNGRSYDSISTSLITQWGAYGEVNFVYTLNLKVKLLGFKVFKTSFHDEIRILYVSI